MTNFFVTDFQSTYQFSSYSRYLNTNMGNMKEYLINYTEKQIRNKTKKTSPHSPVAMHAGTYWLLGKQIKTKL